MIDTEIAFIASNFPSLSETFIYKEVERLTQRGVSIKTFSIRRPKREQLSQESIKFLDTTTYLLPVEISIFFKSLSIFFIKDIFLCLRIFGFLISRKYNNPLKDRVRTFFHFLEGVYFAKLINETGKIKHIHAHYASHPASIAYVASKLTRIPFSFTAHAYDIWEDQLFIKEKIERAKFVVTCTKYGKKYLGKLCGKQHLNKIVSIYHGIDLHKFVPKPEFRNDLPFTILHVGRLHPEKCQIDIINACKNLKDIGISFRCIIIGNGPLSQTLKSYVFKLNLQDSVFIVGTVFQENILKYYQSASVFVLASITENLPNVLVESLATKLPVVAPDINGIPEIVKDNVTGIIIRPSNADDLTQAIIALLDDNKRSELSENGYMLVKERFDAYKNIDHLYEVYKSFQVFKW